MYSTFLRQIYFAFPPPLRVSLPTCLPPRRSTPILMPHLRASKPPERRGKGRKKLARHRAVRSRYQRFAYSVLLHESLAHYLRSRLRGHLPFRFICTRECGQKMSPMPSTPSLRCSEIRSPDGADIVWLHSAIHRPRHSIRTCPTPITTNPLFKITFRLYRSIFCSPPKRCILHVSAPIISVEMKKKRSFI